MTAFGTRRAGADRMVCGLQPVREAIRKHGARLERVLVEASRAGESPQLDAVARFAQDHGATVERPRRAELDRLAKGVRHQGVIAFAPALRFVEVEELELGDAALLVGLDELQDPQNFGAVIRSCVAMGATAVLWPEHSSAPLSPATFRASAGAVEHATLCRTPSLPGALAVLREKGMAVIGLDMTGPTTLDRVDLTGPLVLVAGAEGKGLRKSVARGCTAIARLPMAGPLASLNASVAVAIALYEVLRQRANIAP